MVPGICLCFSQGFLHRASFPDSSLTTRCLLSADKLSDLLAILLAALVWYVWRVVFEVHVYVQAMFIKLSLYSFEW